MRRAHLGLEHVDGLADGNAGQQGQEVVAVGQIGHSSCGEKALKALEGADDDVLAMGGQLAAQFAADALEEDVAEFDVESAKGLAVARLYLLDQESILALWIGARFGPFVLGHGIPSWKQRAVRRSRQAPGVPAIAASYALVLPTVKTPFSLRWC